MAYLVACDIPFTVSGGGGGGGSLSCDGVASIIDTSTLIPIFQISDIDMIVAGQLFAGSFIVVGMFHLAAFALRFVLDSVRGRFN